jgi:hypothetical protein
MLVHRQGRELATDRGPAELKTQTVFLHISFIPNREPQVLVPPENPPFCAGSAP